MWPVRWFTLVVFFALVYIYRFANNDEMTCCCLWFVIVCGKLRVNIVGDSRCGRTSVLSRETLWRMTTAAAKTVDSFLWQPFTTHRHLKCDICWQLAVSYVLMRLVCNTN